MKILFIIATYEPGKDGVGDYVRMLANKISESGNSCSVLAVNDNYVDENSRSEGQVPSLRLSSTLKLSEKYLIAKAYMQQANPQVISFQFVAYSYHPRGYIYNWVPWFNNLVLKGAIIHFMWHELWLGMARSSGWKERLNGAIQKQFIISLIKKLKPAIMHVSNEVNKSALKLEGLSPGLLPTFSNIPVEKSNKEEWIYNTLGILKEDRSEYFILLFFGTIHPDWDHKKVLAHLLKVTGNLKLVIISAGSQGYGKTLWETLKEEFHSKVLLIKTGFLDEKQISDLLNFSDAGLCTTPVSLSGKSGTTMAMLEHGLPVIGLRDELIYRFAVKSSTNDQILFWKDIQELSVLKKSPKKHDQVKLISEIFLKDLKEVL